VRIRPAVVDDAPAMGRVMVESWLSAHRGQVPEAAWQKRVAEWTPEVSARGWARTLAEQAGADPARSVHLVAEDDAGVLIGLVSGTVVADEPSGTTGEVGALYVASDCRGQGVGRALLREAAGALGGQGCSSLRIAVLSANLPARGFYEAMGGREVDARTFDEDGFLLPMAVYAWPDLATV
jgi:ribosomal protein S18 acetylase RimI-like enzyme